MSAPDHPTPSHVAPPVRASDAALPLPHPAGLAWDLLDASGLLLV